MKGEGGKEEEEEAVAYIVRVISTARAWGPRRKTVSVAKSKQLTHWEDKTGDAEDGHQVSSGYDWLQL